MPSFEVFVKQNQAYLVALIIFVFWMLFGSAVRFLMMNSLEDPADSLSLAIQVVIVLDLLYAAFSGAVIIARFKQHAYARTLTRALNILLLFNVPFGTALGLFGLIKVDK